MVKGLPGSQWQVIGWTLDDTKSNPKYRLVTDTELGVVALSLHRDLTDAAYSMGLDHGYDLRVSEDHGEDPKGVSWIEEIVDNEWKKVALDLG